MVVARCPTTQFNLVQNKKRETKTTYQWPRNEGRAKKPELNIEEHSAALSGFGLQRKLCLVLKILSTNQRKDLDVCNQLKSLGGGDAVS